MATTILNYDVGSFVGDNLPVTAGDKAAYQKYINGGWYVAFPDGADEYAAVSAWQRVPQNYAGGALTANIGFITGATTGDVVFEVYVFAITSGDAVDLDSTTSYDAVNSATIAVPATAGYAQVSSITLTNKDSIAAGDIVRILVRRDSDHASDTAAADFYLATVDIQE